MRDKNNPYEVYRNNEGWEWRVLKKYQSPEKEAENAFARWFCAVKSPATFGGYDMGDTYIRDIIEMGGVLVAFNFENNGWTYPTGEIVELSKW